MTIDTSDEVVAVSWDGKPWVGSELGGDGMRVNLVGAFEANNLLRAAVIKEKIRPVAGVSLVIVGEARVAVVQVGVAISTLDVISGAMGSFRVDTILVLTPRGADRNQNGLPWAAIDCPVVIAVVVYCALAVVEESVLTCLQRQGTIGTEEELVTGLRVLVRLHSVLLGTSWGVQNWDAQPRVCESQEDEESVWEIGRAHV